MYCWGYPKPCPNRVVLLPQEARGLVRQTKTADRRSRDDATDAKDAADATDAANANDAADSSYSIPSMNAEVTGIPTRGVSACGAPSAGRFCENCVASQ